LDDILSVVLPMVDDIEYRAAPKGFYVSMIQKALEELGMDTFFDERRESFEMPTDTLTIPLPKGCFNVKNVYLYNGNECNIANSIKVYWARNYFTKGNGFIRNDKFNNYNDPFYSSHYGGGTPAENAVWYGDENRHKTAKFWYNIQMGNLMLSSYCRGVANKVMIHFNGTGCDLGDVPFIPVFLRTAVEDYCILAILRMQAAKDRNKMQLLQYYDNKLNQPYEGSWGKAETRIKTMNSGDRSDLLKYLGRGDWAQGY
jgi:hypothetical protein